MSDMLQQYDDTISLIDLIAVMVRRRRLIIVGTVLAGLLSIAALYLGPSVGLEIGPETVYTAERHILVNAIPTDLEQYISIDLSATLRALLRDPNVVGEVYARLEENPPDDRSQERYLAMIRRSLIDNQYQVQWDSATRILTLSYTNHTADGARRFLDAMFVQVGPELAEQIGPQLAEAASSVNAAVNEAEAAVARFTEQAVQRNATVGNEITAEAILASIDSTGGAALASLATLRYTEQRLFAFSSDTRALYNPLGGASVFEERTGRRSVIVSITTITVFFLTVFLAFVLEYIRRVRAEPEEIAKIEAAWRRE